MFEHKDPQSFADSIAAFAEPDEEGVVGSLNWSNGVLFSVYGFGDSDSIAKLRLSGTLYVDILMYTSMKKFASEIVASSNPKAKVIVVDATKHTTYQEIAKWISTNVFHGEK